MSNLDRAAQFAPFAALTGYEDAIDESARRTDAKAELCEDDAAELNKKIRVVVERKDVIYHIDLNTLKLE